MGIGIVSLHINKCKMYWFTTLFLIIISNVAPAVVLKNTIKPKISKTAYHTEKVIRFLPCVSQGCDGSYNNLKLFGYNSAVSRVYGTITNKAIVDFFYKSQKTTGYHLKIGSTYPTSVVKNASQSYSISNDCPVQSIAQNFICPDLNIKT